MEGVETVSNVVGRLIEKGYSTEFHLRKELPQENLFSQLNPIDFVLEEAYYFSEDPEAGRNIVILAVSSRKYKVKGLLINGFASDTPNEFAGYWTGFKGFLKKLFVYALGILKLSSF